MKTNKNGSSRSKKRPYFELIEVREVKPLDGFKAHFVFTDGSERDIDLNQYIHGGVFEAIRNDRELFCNMFVENGTITWPGEVDIAPDTLYYGDEDPPWIKYDKEQALAAQRAKRVRSVQTNVKTKNGNKATVLGKSTVKTTTRKKSPARHNSRKTVLAKKK